MRSDAKIRFESLAPGSLIVSGAFCRAKDRIAGRVPVIVAGDVDDVLPYRLAQAFGDVARIRQAVGYRGLQEAVTEAEAAGEPPALVIVSGSFWPTPFVSALGWLRNLSAKVGGDVVFLAQSGHLYLLREGRHEMTEIVPGRDRDRIAIAVAGSSLGRLAASRALGGAALHSASRPLGLAA